MPHCGKTGADEETILVTAGYDHTIRQVFLSGIAIALLTLYIVSGKLCLASVPVQSSTPTHKSIVSVSRLISAF